MKIPPPLAWLTDYVLSLERATGVKILLGLSSTVNPLVYMVTLRWEETPSGKVALGAWNIFQTWATKNDCVTTGRSERAPGKMSFQVIIKRRLGPDREESP